MIETTVDVSVIIPAYNEVAQIRATVEEVREYFRSRSMNCQIIVAADGNDGTRELVEAMAKTDGSLVAIGNPERRGKGRGIRNAFLLAHGGIVGFVDADRKTPITEFDKVLKCFDAGDDVVIGSRALPESVIERVQPWYRQIGARAFSVAMHAVIGLHDIPDTQCGFKFFRREVGKDLFARQRIDGYMFDVEILSLARQGGYRIAQVPVRWRDDGDSRLNLVAGNARNIVDIIRIRFDRSLSGRSKVASASNLQEVVEAPGSRESLS